MGVEQLLLVEALPPGGIGMHNGCCDVSCWGGECTRGAWQFAWSCCPTRVIMQIAGRCEEGGFPYSGQRRRGTNEGGDGAMESSRRHRNIERRIEVI